MRNRVIRILFVCGFACINLMAAPVYEQGVTMVVTQSDAHAVTVLDLPEPEVTLAYISISGFGEVNEGSTSSYTCTAFYSDGSSSDVTASSVWSDNSFFASIDANGILDVLPVFSDMVVAVSASYTESGVTKTDAFNVIVRNIIDGGLYSGGAGTEQDPYQIANKSDLLYLGAHAGNYDKHFILVSDIDLAGELFNKAVIAPDLTGGDYVYQGTRFTGYFNGNGHVINNLTIIAAAGWSTLGLFGNCYGSISDLFVKNVNISGSGWYGRNIGALCGDFAYGEIRRCMTTGVVTGIGEANHLGGLCGDISQGSIEDSCSFVNVSGDSFIGGICGASVRSTFQRCFSAGTVSGRYRLIGGFCGYNDTDTSVFHDSYWDTLTSGMSVSDGGIGKITAEMQTQSTFSGWNFASTWWMDGYPVLRTFSPGPVVNLSAISISGPAEMNENSSSNFTCTATYSDGSSLVVTADAVWSENSVWATITLEGTLTALSVDSNQLVVISADYEEGGVTRNDTLEVVVIDVPEPPPYSGGSGTESDPYQIANKADLLYLGTNTTDYSKHFIMTADIDLAGEVFDRAVIAPDGSTADGYAGTPFTGVFDGNGYAVRDLVIYIDADGHDYLGLFGQIRGTSCIVKNLHMKNILISGGGNSFAYGGICGLSFQAAIVECSVEGSIYFGNYTEDVGGICGWNSVGLISRCVADIEVIGFGLTDEIGGLCGVNSGGTISECYSTGEVSGDDCIGGLCGWNLGGSIRQSYSTASVDGDDYIGGGMRIFAEGRDKCKLLSPLVDPRR